ncbi:MAG: hypothetical protein LUC32_02390 [Clostridiales bacterium]|nr:hypothetical protein [Clostridiales bacterium]
MLTLSGVNIDVSGTGAYKKVDGSYQRFSGAAALEIDGNCTATIILDDTTTNILKGGYLRAGLENNSHAVTIDGNGSLTVTGGGNAAGIGGQWKENGENITINGGVVTANGGNGSAGIGGGTNGGAGNNITINGGSITAQSGTNSDNGGAGIGGGTKGGASNIIITGGTVTATSTIKGAGIGSGQDADVENITITGGIVTAEGSEKGAGIGAGCKGNASNIVITGGNIKAYTQDTSGYSADIGGGPSGTGDANGGDAENIIVTVQVMDNESNDVCVGVGSGTRSSLAGTASGIIFYNGSGTLYSETTLLTDITVTGMLAIDGDGGAILYADGGTFLTGTKLTETGLATPVKNGYVFDGWYVNADFSGETCTSITAGQTYYVKWTKSAYILSDYSNDDAAVFTAASENSEAKLEFTDQTYGYSSVSAVIKAEVEVGSVAGNETISAVSSDTSIFTVSSDTINNLITVSVVDGLSFGDYSGTVTITTPNSVEYTVNISLTVGARSLADAAISIGSETYTYDGTEQTPTVMVQLDKQTLNPDTDYTVSYSNNIDSGTASIFITGIGNYMDTAKRIFVINKAAQEISYKDMTLSRTVDDSIFTNELTQTIVEGTIIYRSSSPAVAVVDTDGKVTILEAGVTTITATAVGTDNYTEATASYTLTVADADGNAFLSKFERSDLTDDVITDDLKEEGYDTVVKITDKLTQVLVSNTDYTSENMMTLDVTLMISTDGGVTWVKATEANFPAEGITITIPYPDGTNRTDYDFTVAHMFGMTSTVLGTTAGDTETPAVTKTADGIQVTLKGLSPIAVGWKKFSTSQTTATATTTSTTPTTTTISAQTGDTNPVLSLTGICVSALMLIAILTLVRRRQYK